MQLVEQEPCRVFARVRATASAAARRLSREPAVVLRLQAVRVPFSAVVLVVVTALVVLFMRVPTALAEASSADAGAAEPVTLVFFWGVGCPHCEDAKPFLDELAKEEPRLRVERIEVRKDPEGRHLFLEMMKQLGAPAARIPTFVVGSAYVVGYRKEETDREVRALVRRALGPKSPLSRCRLARATHLLRSTRSVGGSLRR
jgi:thiol-disulfide isomerase/thioredoxin